MQALGSFGENQPRLCMPGACRPMHMYKKPETEHSPEAKTLVRDSARQSLAEAVLAAAAADSIPDVQPLKEASLRVMADKHNSLKYTVLQTSARA